MAAISADDIFKWIFMNENLLISLNISLKIVIVSKFPVNNITALSESMMVSLLTHKLVIRYLDIDMTLDELRQLWCC